jgi:hypothetical protein
LISASAARGVADDPANAAAASRCVRKRRPPGPTPVIGWTGLPDRRATDAAARQRCGHALPRSSARSITRRGNRSAPCLARLSRGRRRRLWFSPRIAGDLCAVAGECRLHTSLGSFLRSDCLTSPDSNNTPCRARTRARTADKTRNCLFPTHRSPLVRLLDRQRRGRNGASASLWGR